MMEISLTSLTSELLAIALRNKTFEKQVENLTIKIDQFSKCLDNSKQCVAYLLDLKKETDKKSATTKEDVESAISFFNSLMESSMAEITEKLAELDKLAFVHFTPELVEFRKALDFPYESVLEKMESKKAQLRSEVDAKTKKGESIKANIEVLKKARDAKKLDIEKSRKHSAKLDQVLLAKRAALEKQKSDKRLSNEKTIQEYVEQLKIVETSNENAKKDNQFMEKEISEIESQIASVLEITEKKRKRLEEINTLREKVEKTSYRPTELEFKVEDDIELKMLREECQNLDGTLEEYTDAEIQQLEKEILSVRGVNAQLEREAQVVALIHSRATHLRSEINSRNIAVQRLQSELDEYEDKVMKYEEQQQALKTLDMSRNSFDFRTPEKVTENKEIYPGIQKINTALRKRLEMETTEKIDDSLRSSFDSSHLSSEFGTTADNSLMGGMFSPLRNKKDPEPSPTKNDFSMLDHYKKFTQNKDKKAKKGQNMFLDSPRSEFSTPESSNNSMIVRNGSEEQFDNDDEDNSLLAPESDLDQSSWNDF